MSKNLHWVVVGARGERRLTKEKVDSERNYQTREGPARGGTRGGRGVAPSRGKILTGANRSSMGPLRATRSAKTTEKARKTTEDVEESEERETDGMTETESEMETEQVTAVTQKKRKNRSREGLGGEPLVKK